MGGSSWSDELYNYTVKDRVTREGEVFSYSRDVRTGVKPKKAHENLDPSSIKGFRESRDSEAHPESVGICVFFDVTGSMGGVPMKLQKKLPDLMRLLLDKEYCRDPQILMGAVGDYYSDSVPLQVGQFESGVEMEEDLSKIFLEGGGGGTLNESYNNAFYFAARKTSMDCWEKRGKKGYLFLIGDEKAYDSCKREEIQRLFGDKVQTEVDTPQLVLEAKEKFNVFFIIPGYTAHANSGWLKEYWESLIGPQNVIHLSDSALVCETIGAAIGMIESSLSVDRVVSDLGASGEVVGDALMRLRGDGSSEGMVPASEGASHTKRL